MPLNWPPASAVRSGLRMALMLWLSACASSPAPTGPVLTPTEVLVPFPTTTASPIPTRSTPSVASTLTPLPSPTPFSYTIARGDTLLAIAFRFGVSMEDLLRVNPGIDPGFLTIGTALVIPIGESGTGVLPTPTPVPLIHGAPQCHPALDGGLWCFLPVLNEGSAGLEGVRGHIDLYSAGGELVASQPVESPVNVIPAGEALPMVAYFPGPHEDGYFALGFIQGAFLANNTEGRYFEASLEMEETVIAEGGELATLSGAVSLAGPAAGEAAEVRITVAAIAYSQDSEVAGLRSWVWEGPLRPGEGVPFELAVYSLGPEIDRVDVLPEIRPFFPPEQE